MGTQKRGRVTGDGAKIVWKTTVKLSVDQHALDVLNEYLEKHDNNFSAAFRAICRDLKNAGGHCPPITVPPAGGHVSNNTAAGAGGRVAVKRVQNPRKRYERHAAYQERAGGAEPKPPVRKVVSEYRDGVRLSITAHMRLQEQADREYDLALAEYVEKLNGR